MPADHTKNLSDRSSSRTPLFQGQTCELIPLPALINTDVPLLVANNFRNAGDGSRGLMVSIWLRLYFQRNLPLFPHQTRSEPGGRDADHRTHPSLREGGTSQGQNT